MLRVVRFDRGSAAPAGVRLIFPHGEVRARSYVAAWVQDGRVLAHMAGGDEELVSLFTTVLRGAGGWAAVQGVARPLLALLVVAFRQGLAEAGGGRDGGRSKVEA